MRTLSLLSLLLCLALSTCTGGDPLAGNTSSETTNGIVAQAARADGSYAAGAQVRLRRADYLPTPGSGDSAAGDRADAVTDRNGRFSLSRIEPGDYRIEISDSTVQQALLLECSLEPGEGIRDLGRNTLEPFTRLTGSVTADTIGPLARRFVRVYGLERLVPVDSTGTYDVPDLPAGKHRIELVRTAASVVTPVGFDTIETRPGDTLSAPLVDPLRTVSVWINTTASGANVAHDLTGFPLLIRLPLTGALDDSLPGEGDTLVEVSKADGSLLPFEVERWDLAAGEACVWVRVDTVHGDSDTQRLFLRWGPERVPARRPRAPVFDTADGCFAVWHLGELPSSGIQTDVTPNGYHAGAHESVEDNQSIAGIAGRGLYNGGRWDFVATDTIGRSPGNRFTLSAWVHPDTAFWAMNAQVGLIEQQRREVAGFHYGVIPDSTDSMGLRLYTGLDAPRFTSIRYAEADWSGGWYHLTAVFDSGMVRLYHNGKERVAAPLPRQWNMDSVTDPIMLGSWFHGIMDEARVYSRALSAAYVKLSYETQRQGQNTILLP